MSKRANDQAKESRGKLVLAISEKFPDLPKGAIEQVANEMAGYMANGAVAQFQPREKIAADWNLELVQLKEIDVSFKDEYRNIRKAQSQRLAVLSVGLQDKLLEILNDPVVLRSTPPQELAKTLKYLVDAQVTLDDGHQPKQQLADLKTLSGIKALLQNPDILKGMKTLNGKEIKK
jgi:hypothetical protein